jgi:hypothetical protein
LAHRDELRALRNRYHALSRRIPSSDKPRAGRVMLGEIYDAGAMPSSTPGSYAVRPVTCTGDEGEGNPATYTVNTSAEMTFLVLGAVPEAGMSEEETIVGKFRLGLIFCGVPVEDASPAAGWPLHIYEGLYGLDGRVTKGDFIKSGVSGSDGFWDPGLPHGRYWFEADEHPNFWFPAFGVEVNQYEDPVDFYFETATKPHWTCNKCGVGYVGGAGAPSDSITHVITGGGHTWTQTRFNTPIWPDDIYESAPCQMVPTSDNDAWQITEECAADIGDMTLITNDGSKQFQVAAAFLCEFGLISLTRPDCIGKTFGMGFPVYRAGSFPCELNQDPLTGGQYPDLEGGSGMSGFNIEEYTTSAPAIMEIVSQSDWPDTFERVIRHNFGPHIPSPGGGLPSYIGGLNWTAPVDFVVTEGSPTDTPFKVEMAIFTATSAGGSYGQTPISASFVVKDADTGATITSGSTDSGGNYSNAGIGYVEVPSRKTRYKIEATSGCYYGEGYGYAGWSGDSVGSIGSEGYGQIVMGAEVTVSGTVTDCATSDPVEGAVVQFYGLYSTGFGGTLPTGVAFPVETDEDGHYEVTATISTPFQIWITKPGFALFESPTQALGCGPFTVDAELTPPMIVLTATITKESDGLPLSGVSLKWVGGDVFAISNASGIITSNFARNPATGTFRFSKAGYVDYDVPVTLVGDECSLEMDIAMEV